MNYFKIGNQDFSSLVSGMKIGYETLVSSSSGRNAAGDTILDIVNEKKKVYLQLRHTTEEEMTSFLSAIRPYVITVSFLDPRTNSFTTMTAYTGTPEPEYYTIQPGGTIYKPLSLNFIEM